MPFLYIVNSKSSVFGFDVIYSISCLFTKITFLQQGLKLLLSKTNQRTFILLKSAFGITPGQEFPSVNTFLLTPFFLEKALIAASQFSVQYDFILLLFFIYASKFNLFDKISIFKIYIYK